jgi:hypothetical protein
MAAPTRKQKLNCGDARRVLAAGQKSIRRRFHNAENGRPRAAATAIADQDRSNPATGAQPSNDFLLTSFDDFQVRDLSHLSIEICYS